MSTLPIPAPSPVQAPPLNAPATSSGERLFTLADLAQLPDDLPSGPVKWELDFGRLIAMPPPGYEHSFSQSTIVTRLKTQGEYRGFGEALGEVTIVLQRDPDLARAPDACFIVAARLPVRTNASGYLLTIPDLVVEIRSPNDTLAELERKTQLYLNAGVRVVWVLDPIGQQLIETRNGTSRIWTPGETVTLDDLIPGFAVALADLLR
jgi:Uma2 family endonuclease